MSEVFYCTLADVKGVGVSEKKIIHLAAEDGDKSGIIDQGNFDACRRSARSVIDSFCMSKYQAKIPFSPVPTIIITIAAKLTKFWLYSRKDAISKTIQTTYDKQIALLEKISKGTMKLYEDTTGPVSQDSVDFTDKDPTDRAFHPDNIQGYFI
jgi:phage gp36-like protein